MTETLIASEAGLDAPARQAGEATNVVPEAITGRRAQERLNEVFDQLIHTSGLSVDGATLGNEKGALKLGVGDDEVIASSSKTPDNMYIDSCTISPKGQPDFGITLLRTQDLKRGALTDKTSGAAIGVSYRLQRFELATDPESGQQVRQLTEYTIDPNLSREQTRSATVTLGDQDPTSVEMPATTYDAQVNEIVGALEYNVLASQGTAAA